MAVRKPIKITAQDEVDYTSRFHDILTSAGWVRKGDYASTRNIPFCSSNRVIYIEYRGTYKGKPYPLHIMVPMAHREYEKRYLNAIEKENLASLATFEITVDPEANAVMRMCL
jgi:hypothetical protein